MPRVPSLDGFSVAPAPLPDVRAAAPEVRNVSGEQLADFGRAVQGVGGVVSSIYVDKLRQANQIRVDDALNRLREHALDLTFGESAGYTRLKGNAALERPFNKSLGDEYGELYQARIREISESLGNDAQRRLFGEASANMYGAFQKDLAAHEAREFDNYAQSVAEGVIANQQQVIALGYRDPAKVEEATVSIRAQVDRQRRLLGRSADWGEARARDMLSDSHRLAILSAVDDGDAHFASQYLDKYRADMNADDIVAVERAVDEHFDSMAATDVANDVFAQGVASRAMSTPENFILPVRGNVSSRFGVDRDTHRHGGIDIAVPKGTAVSASASGKVKFAGQKGSYGNIVIVDHGDGHETRYAHLGAIGVKTGDDVSQGQVLAKSGSSGRSTGPHVHYEIRRNGVAIDPLGRNQTSARGAALSLADLEAQVRSDPRLRGDPRRINNALAQVKSAYAAEKEARRAAEEQTLDDAYRWLDQNNGDMAAMPASLRAAVPQRNLGSLMAFAKAVRHGASEANPEAYLQAKTAITNGDLTRPEELLRYKQSVTRSEFKQLSDDLSRVLSDDRNKLDSLDNVRRTLSFVKGEMAAAGIVVSASDKAKSREFAAFQTALIKQLEAAERLKGKALSDVESRKIAVSLLAETRDSLDSWFGTERGYELKNPLLPLASIPLPVRQQIAASLQRRGIAPSEKAVRDEYFILTRMASDR
jgi:soluble lytic murein transglycosylase